MEMKLELVELLKLRGYLESRKCLSEEAADKIANILEVEHNRIVVDLESLPIDRENIQTSEQDTMGFVLCRGKWIPCAVMNRTAKNWVEFRINYTDGTSDSGVKYYPGWADCNQDNLPCITEPEI
jgi:hypothetical protein